MSGAAHAALGELIRRRSALRGGGLLVLSTAMAGGAATSQPVPSAAPPGTARDPAAIAARLAALLDRQ